MRRDRPPGSSLSLGGAGLVERWLARDFPREGERELSSTEAIFALRAVVSHRWVELSRIWAYLLEQGLVGPHARSEWEQWSELEGALHRRLLTVIERPRALSTYSHEYPAADPRGSTEEPFEGNEIVDPPPPVLDEPEHAALDLRVIEISGRPVVALEVEIATVSTKTDAAGKVHREDISPGRSSLRILSIDAVEWEPSPDELSSLPEGERVGLDLRGRPSSEVEIEVETGRDNCLILERPLLRTLVPDFSRFDHDSALLVPASWTDDRHPLAGIVHAMIALIDGPDRWLLVIGHASAPGKAARNQALSEARADVIRALLEGDRAAWVELARTRGSLRDVIAYLDYLGRRRGWPCACEEQVASLSTAETATTRATVSAFQAEYNARFADTLKVDGVCGTKSLGAVFDVLHDELERWLTKLGASSEALPLDRVAYAGYGATLAGRSNDEAADRVVDLILVEDCPFSPAIDPADVYERRVARRGEWTVPDEPDEWATGPFTIVSDLTPDEPTEPELYRLSSADGSVLYERTLPDEGEVEAGELVLHFPALPTEQRYTLVVVASDGTQSVIFEDRGYGELHGSTSQRG